ncbi:MAG: serine/threonine protein kinase, partial [bacterium]|nr:serine/threonine protein kinase [bacterium]
SSDRSDISSFHGRFLPGTILCNRYRIVSLVGRGGMGEVYRADDLKLGQTVALKFLPLEFADNEKRLAYFHSEVRLTRQISHPNVCRVYDIAEIDGQHFLSMEYVDGEDLGVLLRRIGKLPNDKGIEIAQQLCAGLSAAHENGVLHRDLKPANIMIDGQGRVRITDFGLATVAKEQLAGEIVGTPAYMAPEQITQGKTSQQSDLYSLGLILGELFMGKPPEAWISELQSGNSAENVSSLDSLSNAQITPQVRSAILACLHPLPEDRPKSARHLAMLLPGGDPLEAAVAAGRTPLPEMVINAHDQNQIKLPLATVLFLLTIICLLWVGVSNQKLMRVYETPPAILSGRCAELMGELGYVDLPPDSLFGSSENLAMNMDLVSGRRSAEWYHEQRLPPFLFWRVWTDGSFLLEEHHSAYFSSPERPVVQASRESRIAIDDKGNLLGLYVHPVASSSNSDHTENFDWQKVLQLAGIESGRAKEVALQTQPNVFSDQYRAWKIGEGESELIVQAGAVDGTLNYFEIVGLKQAFRNPAAPQIDGYMIVAFLGNCFVWLVAWLNIRLGRTNWKGASRAAAFIFLLYVVQECAALSLSSTSLFRDVFLLLSDRAWGHAVGHAVFVLGAYLAIEPYVRRFWPRALVGLARALEGRFSDQVVGREVLCGVLAASGILAAFRLVEFGFGINPEVILFSISRRPIHQTNLWLASLTQFVSSALLVVFLVAAVCVMIRMLSRRIPFQWFILLPLALLGILASWNRPDGFPAYVPFIAITGVGYILVTMLTRIGLLSGVVMFALVPLLSTALPVNLHSWYAAYAIFGMAIPFLLAAWGYCTSQGGFANILAALDSAQTRGMKTAE